MAISLSLMHFFPSATFAQNAQQSNNKFGNFEVGIPGVGNAGDSIGNFVENTDAPLLALINAIVKLIIGIIVIIAAITIVVAGYVYMTAGGSGERVSLAKNLIASALLGIVLSAAAFLILNTISPQFADNAKEPTLSIPPPPPSPRPN